MRLAGSYEHYLLQRGCYRLRGTASRPRSCPGLSAVVCMRGHLPRGRQQSVILHCMCIACVPTCAYVCQQCGCDTADGRESGD
jgi:hypothetical protein